MAWIPISVAATAAANHEDREPLDSDSRLVVLVFGMLIMVGAGAILLYNALDLGPLVINISFQTIILFVLIWIGLGVVALKMILLRQRRQQQTRQYYTPYEEF